MAPTGGSAASSHRLRAVVVVAVCAVLLAEVAVRVLASSLPKPQLWSGPEMPVKEAKMQELGRHGGASVAFLGSSTTDVAGDPSLIPLPPGQPPVYNASMGAGTLRMIDLWARHLVVPLLHPKVVVLGVSSRELNPNDLEQVQLAHDFFDAKAVRRILGTESTLGAIEHRTEDVSDLMKYRSVLRQPRRVWDTLRTGRFQSGEFGVIVADDGQYKGFLKQHLTDPAMWATRLPSTVLRDFKVGSGQVATLRSLATFLAGHGTHLIVVNMPVAAVYAASHPGGQATYQAAADVVRNEATRAGARFVDMGVWPDQYFADFGHVNTTGSRRFTETIKPVIEEALAS